MSAVYTLGETVYDIIFKDGQPVAARAGGAMLNTSVSLGRSGHHAILLTETGNDQVGRNILEFLAANHVSTEYIRPYDNMLTPIALAFLGNDGAASYTFYKNYPKNRLEQDFPIPVHGDIVLFGSFYSLNPAIREKLTSFILGAKQAGAVIIYDPNIRNNHRNELRDVFHYVLENISLADIVRGSDEDFENLFMCSDPQKVFSQIHEAGCDRLVMTSSKGAVMVAENVKIKAPARKIKPVSTIGAGDSFNAGIIHGLTRATGNERNLRSLDGKEWKDILKAGIDFATEVCGSYDNYISVKFGNQVRLK